MKKFEIDIKLLISSILIIYLILLLWKQSYLYSCIALVFPLVILTVISKSYIEVKMQDRKCFKECYFHETSLFSKILSSRFMVTIFYLIVSLFMTISIVYGVIDYPKELLIYLVFQIFIIIVLYKFLIKRLSKTIHEKFLNMFSRELTINLSTVALLLVYIYILWNGYEPSYLRESLEETIIVASNTLSSNCNLIDTILRFKIEIDSAFWWSVHTTSTTLKSEELKILLWGTFIFMNGLAILGLNRFIVQVVYLLDNFFKKQRQ